MKIFNKSEWKKVKLGDICDLRNGVAIKSEDYVTSSNTLNCRMSNIRPDGTFDILYNAKYLPDNFLEKYKNYLLKDGDLVIAMTDMAGDPKILGVPTVVKSNGFNIIQNQRVGKLELLTKNIDENYLKLVLQSKKAKNYFKKFSAGGVQLNLSKKEILNVPIILPTIEEQKKLANLFKIIENFIYLRKEELVNLHFLNKSLFNFQIQPYIKEFKIEKLGDIIEVKSSKRVFLSELSTNGIPFYRGTEISKLSRGENVESNLFISKELYENLRKISDVPKIGDLLLPSICNNGEIWYVNKSNPFYFKDGRVLWLKLNKNINGKYLQYYLIEKFKRDYSKIASGTTFSELKIITLKNLLLPVPPIELQNKFAERVEKIEKLKFEIEKSIEMAQNLYDSLISKYFDN